MTKSLELQLEPPYEIGFNWHASRPVNPNSDWVDIKVTDARERVYNGVVTTLEFIRGNMEKNRATGENENGVYFPVHQ
jgi:allantoicase